MRFRTLTFAVLPLLLMIFACRDQLVTAPDEGVAHHPEEQTDGQEGLSFALTPLHVGDAQVTGLNDQGLVVGRLHHGGPDGAEAGGRAALWDAVGSPTALDLPRSSFAAVNNHGLAVGWQADDESARFSLHRSAFVYRDGAVVPITGEHLDQDDEFGDVFLTGSLDHDRIQPWDVNDHGLVIARGLFEHDGQHRRYAFAWEEGRPIAYIQGGQPTALNNQGQIVGFAWFTLDPVVWEPGAYDEPRVMAGVTERFSDYDVELTAINDQGQILGVACRRYDGGELCGDAGTERRGFVVDGGQVVELPLPTSPAELERLDGLNEDGRVVGTVLIREGAETLRVPVLWTLLPDGVAVQELPRGPRGEAAAVAINNQNVVVGQARDGLSPLWTPDIPLDDPVGDALER